MLFENVGNILSENMREIMEYIFEAWCHSFTDKKCIEFSKKKLLNQPLFSPTDGGQERPGPEIYHRQWIHAGGTCSGLSVQKLIIEFRGLPFLRCGGSGASF